MLYNRFFKGAGNAYECIMQIAVKKWNFDQKSPVYTCIPGYVLFFWREDYQTSISAMSPFSCNQLRRSSERFFASSISIIASVR